MPASRGFLKGTARQKVNGLYRHLQMVERQDNKDEEFNNANTDPKKARTRFTDSDPVQDALQVIRDQCEWLLFGSA